MDKYWRMTKFLHGNVTRVHRRMMGIKSELINVSPEIIQGFADGKPIVALESTIITHGMPFPKNLETAMDVEQIIRDSGALPATIAITNGKINVGLIEDDLRSLAEKASRPGGPVKVSRRDLPYVIASKMDGGTTVAGTMMIADMVGIPVFVTGGIGGVHRGGQESLDVSADLTELGRTPVCVVSSGVKSILDIGRTLEYLETQGVCVATYGSSADFPAFYTRKSGFKSPCFVESPLDAAKMVKSVIDLKIRSGLLIAVPVPEEYSMDEKLIEDAIQKSLRLANSKGVRGKEITPLILSAVAEITKGKSLQTNMALIKNNAKVGARIAVELKKLERSPPPTRGGARSLQETSQGQKEKLQINLDTVVRLSTENSIFLREQTKREISPVIIGGSNVDSTIKILEPEITVSFSSFYTHKHISFYD